MSKCVEGKIIEGFEVGKDKVAFSHLHFIDDTVLFCSGKESLLILNHIVAFFESMSGLKINRSAKFWV